LKPINFATNGHEFYLTGMDRMNKTKYPAYPVNPVKKQKIHHCFIKLYGFIDFDIILSEVNYDCY